ncbi:hypothetical protein O6H91_08G050400 [Diphasiastrum complanatum]|uniref:Uncharacterized protein n=1 Tax=Diphasiastrum complanatum TaxID=34168 RepID=A0ACC2CXH0_DIPCM|nr:hypothetical protein O6H91_08G050400 [Diphasiastrum complanatum]
MADKDNSNYSSDNPCSNKKLKVILKLPKGFAHPPYPSLHHLPAAASPAAAAFASAASNPSNEAGSQPPAAAAAAKFALPAGAPQASGCGTPSAGHGSKRKFKSLGEEGGLVAPAQGLVSPDEGLLDRSYSSPDVARSHGVDGTQSFVADKVRIVPTVHVRKPTQKKVEEIGHNLDTRYSSGGSPSQELDATPLPSRKVLESLIDMLQRKDTYQVFAEPVDASLVPDYYDIIKEPMDFSTIRRKLSEGKYVTLKLFAKDVFQISINAMHYNAPKTIYYKQARAIQDAARKALSALKGSDFYFEVQQKKSKFKVLGSKKSWKKSAGVRNRAEIVRSDHMSGATLATGDSQRYESGPQKGGRSYKVGVSEVSGMNLGGAGLTAYELSGEKDMMDGFALDSRSFTVLEETGKPVGWKDGRRPLSVQEYRRSSYKPGNLLHHGQSPSPAGVAGEHSQLIPFGANLKPPAWKYVVKKLQKVLGPKIPFGPGWVGQQEVVAPAPQQNHLWEPVQAKKGAATLQQNNLREQLEEKRGAKQDSKSAAVYQTAAQSCQPASLAEDSRAFNSVSSTADNSCLPIVTSSLINATSKQFVQKINLPMSGLVMDPPTQNTKQIAEGHSDTQRVVMPPMADSPLHASLKNCSNKNSPRKVRPVETLSSTLGMRECNSKEVSSPADLSCSFSAAVTGMSILTGQTNSAKGSGVASQTLTTWDCQQNQANVSGAVPSVGKESISSQSMHLSHQGPVNVKVPVAASGFVNFQGNRVQNLGQSQGLDSICGLEVNLDKTVEESRKPRNQNLSSQFEELSYDMDVRSQLYCNTSQNFSRCQPIPALPPVTQPRESQNSGYQDWKTVKPVQNHPQLQINVSNSELSSSDNLKPFSSQRTLELSSVRSLPPDLNVRLQSPTTPSSRISADSQQPDLALQL